MQRKPIFIILLNMVILTPIFCHDKFEKDRSEMVREQIQARGVTDKNTLMAMKLVPRHLFVPEEIKEKAYEDRPLPIGYGQTISQPYIVAYMTDLLNVGTGDTVLEIGTGSGYQAAILSKIVGQVYTISCFVFDHWSPSLFKNFDFNRFTRHSRLHSGNAFSKRHPIFI